jgi:dihydroorotate dehydrogenase electron transfer subunit
MVSNISSTTPTLNTDSTISAIVRDRQPLSPSGALLRLWLPISHQAGGGFGRFFLVRCADDTVDARQNDWSIYTRRALYCAGMPTAMASQAGSTWELLIPDNDDPGYRWLMQRPIHTAINLLGPLGQPFELAVHTRTLLVLATVQTLPLTLPLVHTMLDRGGRVTLLIQGHSEASASLLSLIPIPVEVRMVPPDDLQANLAEPVRWADQLCAVLPNQEYTQLAHHIRTLRFRLDQDFAHVLVTSELLCGVGACLACVVAVRDGSYTRACLHGPVFPLATIAQ